MCQKLADSIFQMASMRSARLHGIFSCDTRQDWAAWLGAINVLMGAGIYLSGILHKVIFGISGLWAGTALIKPAQH